jgi:hypothetical protein
VRSPAGASSSGGLRDAQMLDRERDLRRELKYSTFASTVHATKPIIARRRFRTDLRSGERNWMRSFLGSKDRPKLNEVQCSAQRSGVCAVASDEREYHRVRPALTSGAHFSSILSDHAYCMPWQEYSVRQRYAVLHLYELDNCTRRLDAFTRVKTAGMLLLLKDGGDWRIYVFVGFVGPTWSVV